MANRCGFAADVAVVMGYSASKLGDGGLELVKKVLDDIEGARTRGWIGLVVAYGDSDGELSELDFARPDTLALTLTGWAASSDEPCGVVVRSGEGMSPEVARECKDDTDSARCIEKLPGRVLL